MALIQSGDGSGNLMAVSGDKAAFVQHRPAAFGALGAYSVSAKTGALAATIAALAPLFSARWADATRFALIERIWLSAATVGAITAAVNTDFDLIKATGFTASDSTGTALTPLTTNKRRTSMGNSLFTDMRIAGTAALTAGTRTLDAQSLRISPSVLTPLVAGMPWFSGISVTAPVMGGIPQDVVLWDAYVSGSFHPIILATNEGLIVRQLTAAAVTGTHAVKITIDWMEVAAY